MLYHSRIPHRTSTSTFRDTWSKLEGSGRYSLIADGAPSETSPMQCVSSVGIRLAAAADMECDGDGRKRAEGEMACLWQIEAAIIRRVDIVVRPGCKCLANSACQDVEVGQLIGSYPPFRELQYTPTRASRN